MKYDPSIGIFGNLVRLFKERDWLNEKIINSKSQTDYDILSSEADRVEAVIDEFNSIVGEEPGEEENVQYS